MWCHPVGFPSESMRLTRLARCVEEVATLTCGKSGKKPLLAACEQRELRHHPLRRHTSSAVPSLDSISGSQCHKVDLLCSTCYMAKQSYTMETSFCSLKLLLVEFPLLQNLPVYLSPEHQYFFIWRLSILQGLALL